MAAKLFNTPLLLLPETAIMIVSNLHERFGVEAMGEPTPIKASRFRGAPFTARMADGSRENLYSVERGVAIIPVMGELVNRGAWIGASSGLTSYEGFAEQMRAAAADPNVRGILLDMESPGGEASGAIETGRLVRQVAKDKPVVALVNSLAASAGYAIASGASQIVITPSGVAGSIGVVMLHLDRSVAMTARGVKPTLIYAGAHKVDTSSLRALPDDAHGRLQASVNELYDLFVSTVAEHRGLTEESVRGTEGGVLMGRAAVEAGLADQVGGFDDSLNYFDQNVGPGTGTTNSFNLNATGARVPNPSPILAKLQPVPTEATALEADHIAMLCAVERRRIQAILTAPEAKGREAMAKHIAFTTDMPADAAIALLATAPAAAAPAAPPPPPAAPEPRLFAVAPKLNLTARINEPTPAEMWKDVADKLNAAAARNRIGFRIPI